MVAIVGSTAGGTTAPESLAPRRDTVAAALLQRMGATVWEADGRTWQFKYVSAEAEQLLGYPVEQWLAQPDFWTAHVHPEDVEWAVAFCLGATASGRDHTFEYRMVAADGRDVWIRDLVTVELHPDGAITLRGAMLDVTDWHRAEQRRSDMERRVQAIFDGAAVGMALIDLDEHLLEVNATFQKMLGYSADELHSMSMSRITHAEDVASDVEMATQLLLGARDHYEVEKRFLRKDGSTVWAKVTASLVRDGEGQPEYGVVMIENLTDRKDLEAQLLQSQKMEALGLLAGGIAHDFNNLLTVIRGYAEFLMLDRPEHDDVRQDANEIRRASDRAATLVRQLLAFSRKQQLFPTVVDVNDVVRDVGTMLKRLLGERVRFLTRFTADLGAVLADRNQLQQVLVNLALNARDAMIDGGTLMIETRITHVDAGDSHGVPAGRYVAIVVTDTGKGIPADVLPRIFEPFFTTKDKSHGTGLGLSTAYGIVRQSGGFITVSSRPGDGTTFSLLFPRASSPATSPVMMQLPAASQRGSETILLVEDEEMVRRLTREALERRGYRVLAAESGPEALAMVRQVGSEIDLVVSDVVMPGMSGPELMRRVGALERGIPVLYISGYADGAIQQEALLAGEHFLPKPFAPVQIEARVREILDAR